MRKAFRHSGVLMMVAVVALGLLGAAYTLWYEDLQLTAQVSTGTLDADVSLHGWNGSDYNDTASLATGSYTGVGRPVVIICDEPLTDTTSALHVYGVHTTEGPLPGQTAETGHSDDCTFGGFPANKLDAATTCDAAIGAFGAVPANANDATDHNLLTLLIGNAFPYAGCEFEIDFHNGGTVPFHINFVPASLLEYYLCDPDGPDLDTAPDNCVVIPQSKAAISWIFDGECDWDGTDANGMLLDGTAPLQLHTGDEARCQVKVLLDQGADLENKVVVSNLRFRAYQWNETVAP